MSECWFSYNCTRPDCPFAHFCGRAIDEALSGVADSLHGSSDGIAKGKGKTASTMCRWGEKCTRIDCWFKHPAERVLQCKQDQGRASTAGPERTARASRGRIVVRTLSRASSLNSNSDQGSPTRKLPVPIRVPVSKVCFTHDSISHHFKMGSAHGGQPISTLVDQLKEGITKIDDLVLDVTEHEGTLKSFRNRRLWCLKQYAEDVGKDIGILVRVFELAPGVRLPEGCDIMRKFQSSNTSPDGGIKVEVRAPSRSLSRSSRSSGDSNRRREHTPRRSHRKKMRQPSNSKDRLLPKGPLLYVGMGDGPIDGLCGMYIENVWSEDVHVKVFSIGLGRRRQQLAERLSPGEEIEWGVCEILDIDEDRSLGSAEYEIEAYPKLSGPAAAKIRVEAPEVWMFDGEDCGAAQQLTHLQYIDLSSLPDEEKDVLKKPQVCAFGYACNRADCRKTHPTGRRVDGDPPEEVIAKSTEQQAIGNLCRYGAQCSRVDCYFNHPSNRAQVLDMKNVPSDGSNVIFVGHLEDHVDEVALVKYFSACGPIVSARVKTDVLGASRGFGFVVFSGSSAADIAASRGHIRWDVKHKRDMDKSTARTSRVVFVAVRDHFY